MESQILPDPRIRMGPVPDFDPGHTFLCGQCFRWTRVGTKTDASSDRSRQDDWVGIAGSHAIRLQWDGSCLSASGTTESELKGWWRPYLDLAENYSDLKLKLSAGDPVMEEAIRFGHGLRLLRQDPWETLITFLISQNNGIPRIRSIVNTLCTCFGEAIPFEGGMLHAFPTPEALAVLNSCGLDVCRAGYRSAYVIRTAQQVVEGRFDPNALSSMPYEEAREYLLPFHGVGVKVADCTLLFSGLHRSAFPVDRWVFRVMDSLYPGSGKTTKELQAFAKDRWGENAGLAQEYLFHYARSHL